MVIKSGTHDVHEALWEFNRNEVYDANNCFAKLAGRQRPKFRLNEPGGNIGVPMWIPQVYSDSRDRTPFFVKEEWRRLIQGSLPTIVNTIAASNFATQGQSLTYTVLSNGTVPVTPVTSDPARLAIYAANGLTTGQPSAPVTPGSFSQVIIPAGLFALNAVLELNAGTFPRPNDETDQNISSIPQPTDVHEDVVWIDHNINESCGEAA